MIMLWGIKKYQDIIQDILIKELNIQLNNVKPGHCMKLTGLPEKALLEACLKLRNLYANIDCWLLAVEPRSDYEITATKLVELRNKQEKPLLVLIPSNLRTAAEDSFGDATFQEIKLEGLEAKAINELERGKKKNPSMQTLDKLAKSLKVSISDILLEDDNTR